MKTFTRGAFLIAAGLSFIGGTALAAAPKWNELTTEQQAILETVRDRWIRFRRRKGKTCCAAPSAGNR